MMKSLLVMLLSCLALHSEAITLRAEAGVTPVKSVLALARDGDTVIVGRGLYKEGNICITRSVIFLGEGMPILDGEKKFEVLSVKADHVTVSGFRIQHSGAATLDDPGGIKVYNANGVTISNNHLYDNFFGVYILYGKNCRITQNKIEAFGTEEQQIGNGIHCWKSDSLQVIANNISGHRDGIYFEFVTHSVIWRNNAHNNIRYGLHFMFSNDDAYFTNIFRSNGAGVAVMFTRNVIMVNNTFEHNWGDAAYGLLLKEISDSYIDGNRFIYNTSGIYMEGTNRILIRKNVFRSNGWGMRIQASCMDNTIAQNNFMGNTFDISTNGSLVLNTFNANYWDRYEGYDLDKDRVGDVPYHPLSLFSVIVDKNPPSMLLYRSLMVTLLDRSEKVIPTLTPDNFVDHQPLMRPLPL
jgi:nitrous oxidase accessory protein